MSNFSEQINARLARDYNDVSKQRSAALMTADEAAEQVKAYDVYEAMAERAAGHLRQPETVVTDADTGGRKAQKLAQFSQIPADVLLELATHYGVGVAKYPDSEAGEPNWQRGYSWRLSVDACMRHFLAFLNGEDMDAETGSSHLIAAMWHLATLRYFQLHDKGRDFR